MTMWFKNIQPYRITEAFKAGAAELIAALAARSFRPAGATDRLTMGWVAPAAHAPDLIAASSHGAVLIALKIEEKLLPSSVVKAAADERIADIEAKELRRVGKKEAKEIRERIAEELLPKAFGRVRVMRALVDLEAGWLWVDSPSSGKAELLTQFLRETLGSLPIKLVQTQLDPVTAMTAWLEHGAPARFTIDDRAVLKAPGDAGARASLSRHDLGAEEIKQHLKAGKLVTELALSWNDHIAFVLNDKLQLKRLQFLDLLQEQIRDADAEDAAALFDAELTLLVLEGRALLAGVVDALGGELQP